jgi:hypothetical protein
MPHLEGFGRLPGPSEGIISECNKKSSFHRKLVSSRVIERDRERAERTPTLLTFLIQTGGLVHVVV